MSVKLLSTSEVLKRAELTRNQFWALRQTFPELQPALRHGNNWMLWSVETVDQIVEIARCERRSRRATKSRQP